jgi:flavin-binding protein dodecin
MRRCTATRLLDHQLGLAVVRFHEREAKRRAAACARVALITGRLIADGAGSQPSEGGHGMAEKVFSISEIAGTSNESVERAIENAIARARQTIRNLEWSRWKKYEVRSPATASAA